MEINKMDVFWNYAATFLKIAASVLLLPFILRTMSAETVGIWSVFMTITSIISLLDFGFNPSFTRNVTYVFSGVNLLKAQGFVNIGKGNVMVDYGLLKGVISAMRWFYLRGSILLLLLLGTIGTYYIYNLLKNYHGSHSEVFIAWGVLCVINTYNLFTLYYDSLLQGRGLIKRSKQIVIVGQLVYLIIATILIIEGKGLIAIVAAQASSVIIVRLLSYYSFFTKEINLHLSSAVARSKSEILSAIYPNAFKVGLTSLGGFMVQKSAIVIGALYLSLEEIASYGITMQLITVIGALSGVYTSTYLPKITNLMLKDDRQTIKALYIKGQFVLLLTYLAGGFVLLFLGEWVLNKAGSNTHLMASNLMLLALFLSFEQTNITIAGGILLSKNDVPFFKAALISGACIVVGLLIAFKLMNAGLFIMLFIPLVVDLSYQTWKWPLEVIRDLNIRMNDIVATLKNIRKA